MKVYESQQDIENEIARQIKEELLATNDAFDVVNGRVRARFADVEPQGTVEDSGDKT